MIKDSKEFSNFVDKKSTENNELKNQDNIIKQINQMLSLLRLNFRVADIVKKSENDQTILITYEQEDERKYELHCCRGLALRRIFPRF
ncbi:MAG: hypothetical protein AAB116_07370 [Candidatus Poribacteria bacterium]